MGYRSQVALNGLAEHRRGQGADVFESVLALLRLQD